MAGVKGQRSGGHNAKTAKQHKLEGTFRKHRHAKVKTSEAPDGVPVPMKPLTGEALAEWTRMLQRLTTSKTISVVDDGAVYQYCQLFAETESVAADRASTDHLIAQMVEAMSRLKGEELVAVIDNLVKLKQLKVQQTTQIRQGRMGLRQYLVEFGMTPASRGRVRIPEGKGGGQETDPSDAFADFDDDSPTH